MAKIIRGTKKYTYDASLKKLKTQFESQLMYLTHSTAFSEVRERYMSLNYQVLRTMAARLSPASMVINAREQQITPFLKPVSEPGQPGFVIYKKGKKDKQLKSKDKRADELTEFINQTGFVYDAAREDDFIDFGKMLLREVLTIDQVAIELQRNRKGEIAAFWLVDGATIRRTTSKGYEQKKHIQFVQLLEEQVVAEYTKEELIFDYMYKRVATEHRGYGYALLEQAVDLVTTLIMGISYNRDLFTKEKIPKGFIALQGEADRESIEAVERYWYMAMSGMGSKFTIPILPSGKDGVALEFKNIGQSNREMEYYKLMLFFLSLFAGVFGMDLAELGIKTDTTQHVLGENTEGRQKYSKSRGLESLLGFIQGIINKIIKKVDEDYIFEFLGINKEDEKDKYAIIKAAIESSRTINEMREEDGLESLEGEENNVSLNPQAVQMRQQLAMGAGGEGEEGEEYEEAGTEEESAEPAQNENNKTGEAGKEGEGEEDEHEQFLKLVGKSETEELENHLESLVKAGYDVDISV